MRKGEFFKKAALAAAICLSLTQSVWAMPSGGSVASGTVTVNGGDFADPVSEQTIAAANGAAIINWNAFGIASGESLTFNTVNGALLNRVTGANVSEIFGTLTQTGANPMFLVNPNGILVGSGATINASNLVLSTLNIDDQDFLRGNYIFNAGSQEAKLRILGDNTKINVERTSEASMGRFCAFGKTVEVADGVTFSGVGENGIAIAAANAVFGNLSSPKITSDANNVLSFKGASVSGVGTVDMQGGKITLADSKIKGGQYFYAEAYCAGNAGNQEKLFRKGDGITAEHVSISASDEVKLTGKTVDLTTVELSGIKDAKIIAARSSTFDENTNTLTFVMRPGNKVTANTLRITDTQEAKILGGKVNLTTADISVRNTENKYDTWIAAVPGAVVKYRDDGGSTADPSFAEVYGNEPANYALTVTGAQIKLETSGDKDPGITLSGGKVTLDQVKATLTGGNDNAIAIASASGEGTTAPGNTITITKSEIDSKGQRLELYGNEIIVDKASTLSLSKGEHSPQEQGLALVASDRFDFDDKTNLPVAKGSQGTIAVSQDSRILLNGNDVTDQFATTRVIPSGDDVLPENPTDRANVQSGFDAMEAVFAKANAGNIQDLTRGLVTDINKESSADNRAKAAQVSGVILAIWQNESLSADAKKALEQEVIQTFYPTQNVLTVSLNNLGN